MAKERICEKCTQRIDAKTELYSVCEGECACFFHAGCVGLNEGDLSIISLKMNVVWMCDKCVYKFRSISDGTWTDTPEEDTTESKSIDEEIRELKLAVSGILETLSKTDRTAASNDRAPLHSTPVSPSMLNEGIDERDAGINSVETIQHSQQLSTDVNDFSLFISNIDISASEYDVHRMVTQALGIAEPECINVSKLVSKWNNHKPLDFVSFKVTLDNKLKTQALNPSIWPKFVKFREFIPRRNVTWRPEQQ